MLHLSIYVCDAMILGRYNAVPGTYFFYLLYTLIICFLCLGNVDTKALLVIHTAV